MIRTAIALLVASVMPFTTALGQQAAPQDAVAMPAPSRADPFLELDTFPLWTGQAEGAAGPNDVASLTVFRPWSRTRTRTAVVVAPGGAYVSLAADHEGRQVADWFAARGVTAFLLKYRVGNDAFLPVPFSDGRRAVQFVRAHAAAFGIDPAAIGMIGFSAGGHLAATTAVTAVPGRRDAADPLDRVSSRPDFLVLAYPWLEGMVPDATGKSQYCMFVTAARHQACDPARFAAYQPSRQVSADAPPTFLFHTVADELVPVEGSVRFFMALRAHGIQAEMHLFEPGMHGMGLGATDVSLAAWPALLDGWMRRRGLLSLDDTVAAKTAR